MTKRVLCLLSEGFEEIETVTPVDLLRRAGAEVVMAALGSNMHVTGRSGICLAKTFAVEGKPVAAICAGPLVLHDAGLLIGRRYTAHDSTYGELTQALAHEHVVEDGNLITSRGAGTALQFGLTLIKCLFSSDEGDKVAKAIMV